jgi:hypothetical protein
MDSSRSQIESDPQLQIRSGVPNHHLHQRSRAPMHGHENAWQPYSLNIQGQQEQNDHQLRQARKGIGRGLHQRLQEHHSEKSPHCRGPHQDLSLRKLLRPRTSVHPRPNRANSTQVSAHDRSLNETSSTHQGHGRTRALHNASSDPSTDAPSTSERKHDQLRGRCNKRQQHRAPPHARGPSGPEIKTIAKEVLHQQTVHQPPSVDVAALEAKLSEHVDAQIAKIQASISTQLEGPLMHDVAHLVEIELLNCEPYVASLQKHFEEFDHSTFSLVEASWKPKTDRRLDKHDRLRKESDALAYDQSEPKHRCNHHRQSRNQH